MIFTINFNNLKESMMPIISKKFLCLCSEFREEYIGSVSKADNFILKQILTNKISTYEVFKKAAGKKYIIN